MGNKKQDLTIEYKPKCFYLTMFYEQINVGGPA